MSEAFLTIAPAGRLRVTSSDTMLELPAATATRLQQSFTRGIGHGLVHLGLDELSTALPADLAYFRDLARIFLASACARADLETVRERVDLPAPVDELRRLLEARPPMPGAEYLDVSALERLWGEMEEAFRAELHAWDGTVQSYLQSHNPVWNLVGRVCLHLAENKRDADHPFAFLATYTERVSSRAKPQHVPLGHAVEQSGAKTDRNKLLSLLIPVEKAAQKSAFIRELLDSGELFEPLAWTPREAYRFLKETHLLEESGVVVRVPDWWKRQAARPQVSVRIGQGAPSRLGLDALLDFSVALSLDGEPLTDAELRTIRASTDGLALVRGRWVEIDRQRLEEVLQHWKRLQKSTGREGLSFLEGMRLLAGAPLDGGGEAGELATSDWSQITAGDWLATTLRQLRDPAQAKAPSALKGTLREYQLVGLGWLRLLSSLRLGACLADDMGLGKTVQILALLLEHKQPARTHILVVPASLIANWQNEMERFAPDLSAIIAHPSVEDPAAIPAERVNAADVVITSYGTLTRTAWLRERDWDLAILDEAQAIKNPGAKQTRAVKELRARARLALTGTPVENRTGDLWSIFDFLNPGLLGSAKVFASFTKRLAASGDHSPLRNLVRPYILRRLKTDRSVIADLPDKTEVRAYCALTKIQAALYQQAVDALKQQLSTVEGMQRRGVVLASLMRFKQICNHPSQWLADGEWAPEASGKLSRLREICESIAAKQEKVLVFTQFREVTEPLAAYLQTVFQHTGLVLHGETAVKQRQKLVDRFQNDDDVPFFVLSVKAGGTGLNLTAASHVIHFDRWWNPAVENQATDRAFRIGQKRNVLVHKLICRGTVEERIDELIESKKGLARELLDGGGEALLTELKDEELLRLVSLDIHRALAEV